MIGNHSRMFLWPCSALPKFFPTVQIFRPHAGQLGDFMGVPGYPQPSGQRAT